MDHPAPLTDLIVTKGMAMQTAVESALGEGPFTLPRIGLLYFLLEGPLPLSVVAARMCCGRSNVTKHVDRLEKEGWVRRAPDPADRRVIQAIITDEGRAACEEAVDRLRAWEASLRERLGEGQADALERLLTAL